MKKFDITSVAALARLELSEVARGTLSSDMETVVSFADNLSQTDSTSSYPSYVSSELREDTVCPSLPRDALLSSAPCQKDGFFSVTRTVKGENE